MFKMDILTFGNSHLKRYLTGKGIISESLKSKGQF